MRRWYALGGVLVVGHSALPAGPLRDVAEGVEDDETLLALRGMGCDAAQGFGIGRPAPADALPGLVEAIERRLPGVVRGAVTVPGLAG